MIKTQRLNMQGRMHIDIHIRQLELFTNGIQIEVKEGIQVRVEKKDSLSSS